MSAVRSANQRRYLAIWFPFLPSDRLKQQKKTTGGGAQDERPLVLIEKVKGALRLAAVDPAAMQAGLAPGLTLADARARIPDLRTEVCRPDLDAAFLAHLLEDFGRFSPSVAMDGADGLILDVTGCAHLFGGEKGLMDAARRRAAIRDLKARCALASTPQAARAGARFSSGGIVRPGEDRSAVRPLPVAALEASEADERALRRAGLKRLADVDDQPRAALAARFGADFSARLARVLGCEDVRITPFRAPSPCVVNRIFAEPISRQEDVEGVLSDLLQEAVDGLEQAEQGGRAFEASFHRVDGDVRRVTVRTGRPTRDAAGVLNLFRELLSSQSVPLDAGFGFDQMQLSVPVVHPLAANQTDFSGERPCAEDLSRLIDRLTARLGSGAVLCFEPLGSHIPERAVRLIPAQGHSPESDWPRLDPGDPPLRPLQVFAPPQPVETLAEVPDGYPMRFRWRRVLHEVVRAEGPERIAGEWWNAPACRTRDYYRVEDREGRRFWLFRSGLYDEAPEPRWFIHGLFA